MSTYTNLLFHIVFSTKYRQNLITEDIQPRLYEYLGGILREKKGITLEIGGMPDHIHILAKLHPSFAISDVLRTLKSSSSAWVNETFSPARSFGWQRGYGAFTVSHSNVEPARKYIQNQNEHHEKMSYTEEFRTFLKRHGIEFDEQYIFDSEIAS